MLFREEDEDLEILPFKNREEAGRILAAKLLSYSGRGDVVVLGLPRGGLPVAAQIAEVLNVPLDVLVVRKLGTPWNRELAMGAVAPGGVRVLDLSIVKDLCISEDDIEWVVTTEAKELERREKLYRGDRPPLALAEQTVILVDDGVATGSTILAAIAAIRRQNAARIVVAIAVIPASGCSAIRMEADEVISVAEPETYVAVSQWYEDFTQISDDDVCSLLRRTAVDIPRAA
ncbi:MAG TPA: phosphoribosyltransferase [Terriglobales bacterium]|nr:phosphoribosyltransferase [Terriglobales bacterium]